MDQDERDFILESAHKIEEWENTPRTFVDPYSDMTSEEKSKLLAYQQELLAGKERENAELHAKLDRLIESQKKSQEAMTSMTVSMTEMAGELKELRLSNAAKDRTIQAQAELLSRNNQAMFGSKSQKRKASKATKSREKEKDDFDGGGESVDPESTEDVAHDNVTRPKARSEAQLKADLLRTGSSYRRMKADRTVSHMSDMAKLPKDAIVLRTLRQYAYEQNVVVTEHEYELVIYKQGNKIYRAYLPMDGDIRHLDKVPGTRASANMMAHLSMNRFALDTPLYRELRRLNDEGMRLSRKTLTNWLHKGSLLLAPIVEELKKTALEKDSVVNCDETWCRVKQYDMYRKRYIWCLVNREAKIVIYCYEDGSRGREALRTIIGDAQLQALQSDGYNVYLYLDNEMVGIDHVCCLAHARAKFQYAARISGDKDAEEILSYIARLYAKENTYRKAGLDAAQIRLARKSAASLEIVGLLRSKMDVLLAEGHPPGENSWKRRSDISTHSGNRSSCILKTADTV